MSLTRLQKVLAAAGVASRRRSEELITEGRVRVNGRVVDQLGAKANPARDRIEVDGKVVVAEEPVVLLMNKPRGTVCTVSDPEGRQTVVELVRRVKARLFPVGRLDYATSGALLLTNDGELAHALTHPRHGVEKVYVAKLRGRISEETLERWRKGVELEDGRTAPAEAFRVEEEGDRYTWVQLTIKEGRNRQVRRMAEATGHEVIKLKRLAFAGLSIDGLRVGQYRDLTARELSRLKRDHVNPARKRDAGRARRARSDDAGESPTARRQHKRGRRS